MPRLTTALAFAFLLLIPVVASAEIRLLDPVTTYTNGMPLASSTPLRSHNVNYRCDPDRSGCCGGRYNFPCLNSLCHPDNCCTGSRPMQHEGWGMHATAGVVEGVEVTRFEQLGTVPAVDLLPAGPAAPASRPSLLQQLTQ